MTCLSYPLSGNSVPYTWLPIKYASRRKNAPNVMEKKGVSVISTSETLVMNDMSMPKSAPPTRATRTEMARKDWTTGRVRNNTMPKTITT